MGSPDSEKTEVHVERTDISRLVRYAVPIPNGTKEVFGIVNI